MRASEASRGIGAGQRGPSGGAEGRRTPRRCSASRSARSWPFASTWSIGTRRPRPSTGGISSLSSFYKFRGGAAAELRLPVILPNPAHVQFVPRSSRDPRKGTKALTAQRARQLMALPAGDSVYEGAPTRRAPPMTCRFRHRAHHGIATSQPRFTPAHWPPYQVCVLDQGRGEQATCCLGYSWPSRVSAAARSAS